MVPSQNSEWGRTGWVLVTQHWLYFSFLWKTASLSVMTQRITSPHRNQSLWLTLYYVVCHWISRYTGKNTFMCVFTVETMDFGWLWCVSVGSFITDGPLWWGKLTMWRLCMDGDRQYMGKISVLAPWLFCKLKTTPKNKVSINLTIKNGQNSKF